MTEIEDEPYRLGDMIDYPRKRDMGDKSTEEYWTGEVKKVLLGKKIVKVEFMDQKAVTKNMWGKRPICLLLDDGNWIYPMMDDEGNDGGAMGTTFDKLETIPVL